MKPTIIFQHVLLKAIVCIAFFEFISFPNVLIGQSFNHPISGFEDHTLGAGTYHYYDNGGPNGNYSNDINGSSMHFTPEQGYYLEWKFVQYEFELDPFCGPDQCCDRLTSSWLPNCSDLFITQDYCGSFVQPCCATEALCTGEGITFSFTSDASVPKPGWHIIIYVNLKDPYHMVCGSHQLCTDQHTLDCSGVIGVDQSSGTPRTNEVFYCWAFGTCAGQVDYYLECDNGYYPGAERFYSISLSQTQDLTLSCECITDLFLVTIYQCEVYTCQKADEIGGEFYLDDVPEGEHFLIAEYDCGGDLCGCDLQFSCLDPSGGELGCDDAAPVECGDNFFDATFVTTGGVNNVDEYCENDEHEWTGREKVYEFVASLTGEVTVTITGLNADLDLFVLDECDPTSCVSSSLHFGTEDEIVIIDVFEGEHYFIVVDGYLTAESVFWISIDCSGELDCGDDEPIECGDEILSSNSAANGGVNSEVDYCGDGTFKWTGRERIYTFYAERNGILNITLSGLNANLDLFLLEDCNSANCLARSNGPGLSDEFISFEVHQAHTYIIVIDGVNGATSTFSLEVDCDELMCKDCGDCFTYTIFDKGSTSNVTCLPKYVDCGVDHYPTVNHQFQWTVDGNVKSTKYAPTLSLENNKKSKVCQIVKYKGDEIYKCCWDIKPTAGCSKPPVAHAKLGGEWPYYDAVLDASESTDGARYSFEFGDGTLITDNGADPTIEHTYSAGGPKYSAYVQNDFGISVYTRRFAPGAIECTAGQNPKFTYTLNGRSLTVKDVDNTAAGISSYIIDFGDSTAVVQGNAWADKVHVFAKDSVYEICIRYVTKYFQGTFECSHEGCMCFSVKVGCCLQTIDQCYDIRPIFLSEQGGFLYNLVYDAADVEVLKWEIDGVVVPNSETNTLTYTFPGTGYYNVCCHFRHPVTGCYIKCCKRIYVDNPFTCGNIIYSYVPSENGYRFDLDRAANDVEEILWTVDDPVALEIGTNLQSDVLKIPAGACVSYIISVRYYDKVCSCYRLCCLRLYLCNPLGCSATIKSQLLGNGKTRFSTDVQYQQMKWLANDQVIGTGSSVDYQLPSGGTTICLQYFDQVTQQHRQCCRDIMTATDHIENLDIAEIAPNPTVDFLNIYLSFKLPTTVGVELMSELGVIVRQVPNTGSGSTKFNQRLDMGDLPPGMYLLRIRTSGGEMTRKIIRI